MPVDEIRKADPAHQDAALPEPRPSKCRGRFRTYVYDGLKVWMTNKASILPGPDQVFVVMSGWLADCSSYYRVINTAPLRGTPRGILPQSKAGLCSKLAVKTTAPSSIPNSIAD